MLLEVILLELVFDIGDLLWSIELPAPVGAFGL